ncbi:hypothetical protein G3573_11700, partial [Caulobacter sp. 17J65-9]|nr:hypothetical protein [Caulobacter sp. 17J65-9]
MRSLHASLALAALSALPVAAPAATPPAPAAAVAAPSGLILPAPKAGR